MPILDLQDLRKSFGGLKAVDGLNLTLEQGEILGLIGPNGAGKTTVFNLITGVHRPTAGRVVLNGEDVTRLQPHQVAARGISRTFQHSSLFQEYTALENVLVAYHLQARAGFWRTLTQARSSQEEEQRFRDEALNILRFMGIEHLARERARNLPHGHQRVLGVCIALALRPSVLLLDEPLTGMNPGEAQEQVERIQRIRAERDVAILLVEHNMRAVMTVCDRLVVMNFGRKIAEGTPLEITDNPAVIEAYLGVRRHA